MLEIRDRKVVECSEAIARAVQLCRPGVISAYPITPQTHIVENLARFVASGDLKSEFIDVESEHSAMSSCIGAEACGVRTFTASSSQGIALMSEMLFVASGMRLPVIMAVANRALSAPINIWNDHSDTMAQRDSGWIQFYCENSQEAYDTIIQAYKISENKNVMLPAMVCVDGFTLSHLWEPVSLLAQERVDSFLPKYSPEYTLNPEKPLTLGSLAYPDTYMQLKKQQQDAMVNSLAIIKKTSKEFEKNFSRCYGNGLIEAYRIEDAKKVLLCAGSVCGTVRDFIDKQRSKGKKIGLIKLKVFRPFPENDIKKIVKGIKELIILDRAVSFGNSGPLFTEIKSALSQTNIKIKGCIAGLGGRDIAEQDIQKAINGKGGWLL